MYNLKGKIKAFTTDGGSDMVSACEKLGINRCWCSDHIANLGANDMFKVTTMEIIHTKCRSIATHFHESSKSTRILNAYDGQEVFHVSHSKNIIGFSKTRFISSFDMINSIKSNIGGISHVFHLRKKDDIKIIQFTMIELVHMYQIVAFLQELKDMTLLFEQKKTSTLGEVLPYFFKLIFVLQRSIAACSPINQLIESQENMKDGEVIVTQDNLEETIDYINKMKGYYSSIGEDLFACTPAVAESFKIYKDKLVERFSSQSQKPELLITTSLHPTHKHLSYFEDHFQGEVLKAKKEAVFKTVKVSFENWLLANSIAVVRTSAPVTKSVSETKTKKINFSKKNQQSSQESQSAASNLVFDFENEELNSFFSSPEEELKSEDIISWWSRHQKEFPLLSLFVKEYLVISSTSASSERLFSKGKHFVDDLRFNLSADNLAMSMFLCSNKDILEE